MGRQKYITRQEKEHGVIITLVAVFMLFVIGAMAALSIDVVTLYTARSEAQLAADSAALAGARVIANSGATSDPSGSLMTAVQMPAKAVAFQVAQSSFVGGRYLIASQGEVTVNISTATNANPQVSVTTQRSDLPTFFARIWGRTQAAVAATATAEAYNPSPGTAISTGSGPPVAPLCVKPWLLPNKDPTNSGNQIFDPTSGLPNAGSYLLGWSFSTPITGVPMSPACPTGTCSAPFIPAPWNYYPGDPGSFVAPTQALPTCTPALTTGYQESIAGCVVTPISCNSKVNIDINTYAGNRNSDTTNAVNCVTHATASGGGDTVATTATATAPANAPFQFVAGTDNPIPSLASSQSTVMVSDSLATVPVFDSSGVVTQNVQIIGFVQVFLNPNGNQTLPTGNVNTTVINLAGCGAARPGLPILGNGASPVAVRLISPPVAE
jgi:hypothetical protein